MSCRFWHSSAAYAIAKEAKCGSETNIPSKGHSIYQWPSDLLKPSAVVFLELNERDRILRLSERGAGESMEEMKLRDGQLRKRQVFLSEGKIYKKCRTVLVSDLSKN